MTLLDRAKPTSTLLVAALLVSVALPTAGLAQQPAAPAAGTSTAPRATDSDKPGSAAAKHDDAAATSEPAKIGAQPKSEAKAGDADQTSKSDSADAATHAKDPRMADRQAFFDARLAALHAGLTLTADQEALWSPVDSAIRGLQKIRGRKLDREQVAKLLDESPSDLLRLRSEQLVQRGEAMKALVDATGPLLDKLDDTQKRRLPLLLDGMGHSGILRAAFDIRFGRVQEDHDDDSNQASRHGDHDAAHGADQRTEDGMGRRHRHMHDQGYGQGDDEREGAAYDDGRGNPMAMQGGREDPADD